MSTELCFSIPIMYLSANIISNYSEYALHCTQSMESLGIKTHVAADIFVTTVSMYQTTTTHSLAFTILLLFTSSILLSLYQFLDTHTRDKAMLFLGGSFNPIHNNHITVLSKIKQQLESHYNLRIIGVYLVPSTDEYVQKKLKSQAISFKHRQTMCKMTMPYWIKVSNHAYHSTSEYIKRIQTQHPNILMVNCMGEDILIKHKNRTNGWMKYTETIPANVLTVVLKRNGYNYKSTHLKSNKRPFIFMKHTEQSISSTKIRSLIHKYHYSTNREHQQIYYNQLLQIMDKQCIHYMLDNMDKIWIASVSDKQTVSRCIWYCIIEKLQKAEAIKSYHEEHKYSITPRNYLESHGIDINGVVYHPHRDSMVEWRKLQKYLKIEHIQVLLNILSNSTMFNQLLDDYEHCKQTTQCIQNAEMLLNNLILNGGVQYLSLKQQNYYKASIMNGIIVWSRNNQVLPTIKMCWCYVIDNHELYVIQKCRGFIQHTSLVNGQPIDAAGILWEQTPVFYHLKSTSGHYEPTLHSLLLSLQKFKHLKSISLDSKFGDSDMDLLNVIPRNNVFWSGTYMKQTGEYTYIQFINIDVFLLNFMEIKNLYFSIFYRNKKHQRYLKDLLLNNKYIHVQLVRYSDSIFNSFLEIFKPNKSMSRWLNSNRYYKNIVSVLSLRDMISFDEFVVLITNLNLLQYQLMPNKCMMI